MKPLAPHEQILCLFLTLIWLSLWAMKKLYQLGLWP